MFPLTLAMGASIAWGASDFLGGMVSRRLPVAVVLLGAQLVGLLLAALAWAFVGAPLPNGEAVVLGGAAGVAELLGFACPYRGLAIGEMTAVAPLSALTAVLPVGVAGLLAPLYPLTTVMLARALLHERLGAPRLAGAVAVLGGVALISASAGA